MTKVMLKGKLEAFTTVVIITRGGSFRNIQSQSEIPFAGGHTPSEPVSSSLYFAPHSIYPGVFSEHPQIVYAHCLYPYLHHYFHSHGFLRSLLFLNHIRACCSPHEKHLLGPYCSQIEICLLWVNTQVPFHRGLQSNVFDFKSSSSAS